MNIPRAGKDSFCEYRWTSPVVSLSQGNFRFCCRSSARSISETELKEFGREVFLNSQYDQSRRAEMLRGERHGDCNACWKLEDSGLKSRRLQQNDFYSRMGWDQSKAPGRPEWLRTQRPESLEIMLSNICDMKCVYCSPQFSSKWAQEMVQFDDMPSEMLKSLTAPAAPGFEAGFWEALEFDILPSPNFYNIIIIGGEPLINERFYSLLDRLYEICKESKRPRSRKLELSVVTNLNCSSAQLRRFIDRIRSMSDLFELDLSLSMESVGARAEYIRHGLNWEQWLLNFSEITGARLSANGPSLITTLNALCVTSLKPLLELCAATSLQNKIPISLRPNIVTTPACLSPTILPASFADYLTQTADFVDAAQPQCDALHLVPHGTWKDYAIYLRQLASGLVNGATADRGYAHLLDFLKRNDQRRGSQFLETFPEYREFLNS